MTILTTRVRRAFYRVLTSDPRGLLGVALVALVASAGLLLERG